MQDITPYHYTIQMFELIRNAHQMEMVIRHLQASKSLNEQILLIKGLRFIGILRLILIAYLFLFSLLVIIPLCWVEGSYYNLSAIEDGGKFCLFSLFVSLLY